jgi:hypothetical protein
MSHVYYKLNVVYLFVETILDMDADVVRPF